MHLLQWKTTQSCIVGRCDKINIEGRLSQECRFGSTVSLRFKRKLTSLAYLRSCLTGVDEVPKNVRGEVPFKSGLWREPLLKQPSGSEIEPVAVCICKHEKVFKPQKPCKNPTCFMMFYVIICHVCIEPDWAPYNAMCFALKSMFLSKGRHFVSVVYWRKL